MKGSDAAAIAYSGGYVSVSCDGSHQKQMAKIRVVEHFDAGFSLSPAEKEALFDLLRSEIFLTQIAEALKAVSLEFTGLLFQPVPYSAATPKGMPAEFEAYYESKEYAIVNVPPNFMFKAKIFSPSRLCAVYRLLEAKVRR